MSESSEQQHPLAKLLEEDRRYAFDAYVFVFEALTYAQNVLNLGAEAVSEVSDEIDEDSELRKPQQHVTGQELCHAIRSFALDQFGYLAKSVLNNWGIHNTGDFGEIVFNLIEIGQMHKTPDDRREDFDDVYDFEVAFREEFTIHRPR